MLLNFHQLYDKMQFGIFSNRDLCASVEMALAHSDISPSNQKNYYECTTSNDTCTTTDILMMRFQQRTHLTPAAQQLPYQHCCSLRQQR